MVSYYVKELTECLTAKKLNKHYFLLTSQMLMSQYIIFFGYKKSSEKLNKKENVLERYGKAHRIKEPDIEKAAAAGIIKLQQSLDHLSVPCEGETSGRMSRVCPLQLLPLLEYGVYLWIPHHINIAFTGREVIPQEKMECK